MSNENKPRNVKKDPYLEKVVMEAARKHDSILHSNEYKKSFLVWAERTLKGESVCVKCGNWWVSSPNGSHCTRCYYELKK